MAREKTFNEERVLYQVLQLYWTNGYKDTSLADMERATKLTKPSLYNAYGNKEAIYVKCLKVYQGFMEAKLEKLPRGIAFIESFFNSLIIEIESKKLPEGCLVMNSAIEFSGEEASDLKVIAVTETWKMIESYFKKAIIEAKKSKEISPIIESEILASWLLAQLFAIRGFSKISPDLKYCKAIRDEVLKKISNLQKVSLKV